MVTTVDETEIAIVGLGCRLPLAIDAKSRPVRGFDINEKRVTELNANSTLEVTKQELTSAALLTFTHNLIDIASCNCFILTVPTPIDAENNPDLMPLTKATESVASILKSGDLVISTVFPGATEEHCVPILERLSGLRYNVDFFCGYSPERINPGDSQRRVSDIIKVTSGSTPKIARLIIKLYKEIAIAGTHLAPSIKVAEAAKVIENVQRDVNIALVNEFAKIFDRMNLDTGQVLAAAETKWNFLPFKPGLVGGIA